MNNCSCELSMIIVGQISSKEEAQEITFIAKLFVVGPKKLNVCQYDDFLFFVLLLFFFVRIFM